MTTNKEELQSLSNFVSKMDTKREANKLSSVKDTVIQPFIGGFSHPLLVFKRKSAPITSLLPCRVLKFLSCDGVNADFRLLQTADLMK